MKDASTKFPQEIDDRIFWQDLQIYQTPIMQKYYTYLNAGNYDEASDLLNNSDVFFYGAWILNLLENRLYAIEKYVFGLDKNKIVEYQKTEPFSVSQGTVWID